MQADQHVTRRKCKGPLWKSTDQGHRVLCMYLEKYWPGSSSANCASMGPYPLLTYVATLPCKTNVTKQAINDKLQGSLATYLLITSSLQIYKESFTEKKLESQLRFDRIMAMSFCSHNLWPTVYDKLEL